MNRLDIRLNGTIFDNPNITQNTLAHKYPCPDSTNCSEYSLNLHPGTYKIEAYGASGGSYNGIVSSAFQSNLQSCISQEIFPKTPDSFLYLLASKWKSEGIFMKRKPFNQTSYKMKE